MRRRGRNASLEGESLLCEGGEGGGSDCNAQGKLEVGATGGFPADLEKEKFNALHHECPACKMHMDMEECTCEHEAGVWWGARGRLFMFQRHMRRYNELGMAREDPTAHRWRPEKLICDVTWCMPVAAWQTALSDIQAMEQNCLLQILKAHKKVGDPLPSSIIEEYSNWGPDNEIWARIGIPWFPRIKPRCPPEGSHTQGSNVAPPAVSIANSHAEQHSVAPPVAAPTTPKPLHKSSEPLSPSDVKPRWRSEPSLLSRRLQLTTQASWGGERETEVFEKFRILTPFDEVGSLQWLGGTYAAHPQMFPREQSELEWITQKLLPLGILPPHRFITWTQSQWQRTWKHYETFPPGSRTNANSFRQNLMGYTEDLLERPDPMRPEQIDAGWKYCFDWFGGVPSPCSRAHEARVTQHLGKDTKTAGMRVAALQRGVPVSNQAYANRGYGELFPFGKPQWIAADNQSHCSSGIDPCQWDSLPQIPVCDSDADSGADTSATDDDACFEHD